MKMDGQQSQKRGVESDAQKRASTPKDSTSGQHAPDRQTDKDAALGIDDGRLAQRQKPWNEREKSEDV